MAPHVARQQTNIIDIAHYLENPVSRGLYSFLKYPIEKGLSITAVNNAYRRLSSESHDGDFFNAALDVLGVKYSIATEDLKKIPVSGPLVVVSNHPFGGLEGLVIGALLMGIRPDFKMMGNYLLGQFRELRAWLVSVDPFGNGQSKPSNVGPMKQCLRWVKDGGALITFPAGEVSHLVVKKRQVADPPWSPHIGAIIRHAHACALPMYFDGRNSSLFQLAGMVHPRLRTAMLARELTNKTHSRVRVFAGRPVPWSRLKDFDSDEQRVNYLRMRSHVLRHRTSKEKRRISSFVPVIIRKTAPEAIPRPADSGRLRREVEALSDHQHLVQVGDFSVYVASSHEIPKVLREIGRLRELTFREVQEGTGKALDLDRFDQHYRHLFLWNHGTEELVGAYRLGLADEILGTHGKKGLYTNTLFRFKPAFLARLGNAMELGRSFVRSEYQRKKACLSLIWRGIGEFIGQNPHYTILFGPVSISEEYHFLSKNLMVQFLRDKKLDPELSRYVRARKPHRMLGGSKVKGVDRTALRSSLRTMEDVSALVSEIEADGKGVPVLLKHYLKLNATLLSFNKDKSFSNVLDGLIWVDLTRVEKRLLKRYMGETAFCAFTQYHAGSEDVASSVTTP